MTPAISNAFLDDAYAADKNNGSFLEWTAIESVADAEPATVILGLPFTDVTFPAGTMMTLAQLIVMSGQLVKVRVIGLDKLS